MTFHCEFNEITFYLHRYFETEKWYSSSLPAKLVVQTINAMVLAAQTVNAMVFAWSDDYKTQGLAMLVKVIRPLKQFY